MTTDEFEARLSGSLEKHRAQLEGLRGNFGPRQMHDEAFERGWNAALASLREREEDA